MKKNFIRIFYANYRCNEIVLKTNPSNCQNIINSIV